MKKLIILILIIASFAGKTQTITAVKVDSTTAYQTIYNNTKHETTLRGLIKRSLIEGDTTFAWFAKNYKLGKPNDSAVAAFKAHTGDVKMIIFGGTWCEDTQNILPQFFKMADAAGYADSNITLIGVDRSKNTIDNLSSAFQVTKVPTFIVLKNGKEVGRVTEYGESGEPIKELGKIVATL